MTKLRNLALALGLSTIVFSGPGRAGDLPKITVYKTPTCGCCKQWVSYLETNGFPVETVEMSDLSRVKAMSGVTPHAPGRPRDGVRTQGPLSGDELRCRRQGPGLCPALTVTL